MRTLYVALATLTLCSFHAKSETEKPTILNAENFSSWHADLQPREEAWTTIPWQVSLVPAQQLAAREGKPLFVWAMDGHPLGCT